MKHTKDISSGRKTLYYVGMGMVGIGFILFMSTFVMVIFFDPFSMSYNPMGNAIIGFIMIAIGGFIQQVGARGDAGSGVILDPKKAREDLHPYTSAFGGMVSDVLDEVKDSDRTSQKEVIKIRCPQCSSLNDEDARFCKSCGKML